MSTNQQYIDRALVEIKVLEKGQSADTTDSATGLAVFNQMMHAWGVSDKDFDWFTQDDLTATTPLPDWAESGVISNLAIELAAPFETPVSAPVLAKALSGENLIIRTLINLKIKGTDLRHLPLGQGRFQHNILTDS